MDLVLGAGDADIGQPPLLLQPGDAGFVQGALMREQPFLPTGQEDLLEFQPLGRMQGHQIGHVGAGLLGILHHQADMLQEAVEVLELLHAGDQLFQIFQPARRIGRFVGLPHGGVSGFVEHGAGKLRMRNAPDQIAPAGKIAHQSAQRVARPGRDVVGVDQPQRRFGQRHSCGPGNLVQRFQRRRAEAATGRVDDALEGEVVIRLGDYPQIGQRIADLHAFVETRPADHPVRDAQRDQPLLELAHLEAGAHQDGDLRQSDLLPLQRLDLVADPARLLLAVPDVAHDDLIAAAGVGEQGLAQPAAILRDQPGGGAQYTVGGAVIALQPDHLGARKIGFEAQNVADLGATPAIDRLIVVADAANVLMPLRQ